MANSGRAWLITTTALLIGACGAEPAEPTPVDLAPYLKRPCDLLTDQFQRAAGVSGTPERQKVNLPGQAGCVVSNESPNTSGSPTLGYTLDTSGQPTGRLVRGRPGERVTVRGYRAASWLDQGRVVKSCDLSVDFPRNQGVSVLVVTRHDGEAQACDLATSTATMIIDQLQKK